MNMRRSFPGPNEAIEMEVEALAMCLLDRLISTPEDKRAGLMSREGFINHHITHAYQEHLQTLRPAEATVTRSGQARQAFPDYSQALAEAWSLLERQGLLISDGRRETFISRDGQKRHASYRAEPPAQDGQAVRATSGQPPSKESRSSIPTAAVLWAHSDPSWNPEQERAWEEAVVSFTNLLREQGVDADLDLFHGHEPLDWSRFGPRAIENCDFILVAVSPTWRHAFEGKNQPTENAGAVGEANALRGLFSEEQADFQKRVILVVLPGRETSDIPRELRATATRVVVSSLTPRGLEGLLRVMHGRPAYAKAPVGPAPELPARSVRTSETHGANTATPSHENPSGGSAPRRSVDQPSLRPLAWPTGTFNLHLPAGPLNAHLSNDGGSTASIVGATLSTPFGDFEGVMWVEEQPPLAPERGPTAELERDAHLTVCFGGGTLAGLLQSSEPLRLGVRYRADGLEGLYEYRLKLHRAGATPSARPQWRGKDPEVVVIG